MVSFAKEPYKRDYILQKRPIISAILLTVATPYTFSRLRGVADLTRVILQSTFRFNLNSRFWEIFSAGRYIDFLTLHLTSRFWKIRSERKYMDMLPKKKNPSTVILHLTNLVQEAPRTLSLPVENSQRTGGNSQLTGENSNVRVKMLNVHRTIKSSL